MSIFFYGDMCTIVVYDMPIESKVGNITLHQVIIITYHNNSGLYEGYY